MARVSRPEYYEQREWSDVWDFTDSQFDWTVSGSSTIEVSTDPYTGEPALKWSNFVTGEQLKDLSLAAPLQITLDDYADYPIEIQLSTTQRANGLSIAFGMGGLATAAKRQYNWASGNSVQGPRSCITHQSIADDPVFGAAEAWSGTGNTSSTCDRISLVIIGTVPDGQVIYLSKMRYGGRERTKVLFGLDNHVSSNGDIYTTIYQDLQAIDAPGYMAWSYGANPFLSQDDLDKTKEMYNSGWTICNHSYSHLGAISEGGGDYDFVVSDYSRNSDAMIADGFLVNPKKYAAMPKNELSDGAKSALLYLGFSSVRTRSPVYLNRFQIENNPLETGTYSLNGTTTAAIQHYIDSAILLGNSINVFSHGIGVTSDFTTQANWDYFVELITRYKNLGLIDIVSIDEWFVGLGGHRVLSDSRQQA